MKERYAPIVLFVYNRPEHTRKTVESLARNGLAKESILYIFSDAPKTSKDDLRVNKVRDYIATLSEKNFFKEVYIEKALSNKGLANSIISGVTAILKKYGKVIVLEDDLITSSYFLNFMNDALNYYEDDQKIGSIASYVPVKIPNTYKKDIWISRRTSSHGWATWYDRWKEVDWDITDFSLFSKDKNAIKEFNAYGSDRFDRLRRQLEQEIDSWSVRFGYWQFKADKYTIFPSNNLIQNIGWDGSGTHEGDITEFQNSIIGALKNFTFERDIKENEEIRKEIYRLYSGNMKSRFARYLRNNGFERLEAFLRSMLRKKR